MPILMLLFCLFFSFGGEAAFARLHRLPLRAALGTRGPAVRALASLLVCPTALALVMGSFRAPLSFSRTSLLLAVCFSFLFALLCFLFRCFAGTELRGRLLLAPALALLLALSAETFFCNYRTFMTAEEEPISLTDRLLPSNVSGEADENGNYPVLPGRRVYLYADDLDIELHNLYLYLDASLEGVPLSSLSLLTAVTDDGNSVLLSLPERTLYPARGEGSYITFSLSGKTTALRLTFEGRMDCFAIREITANARIPFAFSPYRAAVFFAAFLLAFALRPGSTLYRVPLHRPSASPAEEAAMSRTSRSGSKFLFTALCVLLLFGIGASMTASGGYLFRNIAPHQEQYNDLADAFLHGKLYLYRSEVPDWLIAMDNPYDTVARDRLSEENGTGYYWDAAYYNGRYYVYFGVLPVLLLYLPFRALTGMALPNAVAILMFGLLYLAALFYLLYALLCRYGRPERTPFLLYLLLGALVATASGVFSLFAYPDLYSVPILAGLFTMCAGLGLWLRAKRQDGTYSGIRLFFGSLFVALTAACRPQLLLLAFFALPLFGSAVFRERTLFSQKTWRATLALCLPFLLVALPLCFYNAARFASPFDFGANYNLTTNDMTVRGYRVGRLGLAAFTYLFQPPSLTAAFPFLSPAVLSSTYMGVTVAEGTYGGLFAVCPFALFALLLFVCRRENRGRGRYAAALFFLFAGVFLALFDAQGAGLLQRYYADFSLPILLSAFLSFLSLYEAGRAVARLRLRLAAALCLAASAGYSCLLLFCLRPGAWVHLIFFWG